MKRALLSVYDKTGLVPFATALNSLGFELVSTGRTYRALEEAALPVVSVSSVTGFPEILDGRVKTLHPAIHGGLLARQDDPLHLAQLAEYDIAPIDMLVSNLYPFEATVADPNVTADDAIEQIDIGGPAMLRAAAKNFASVIVVSDPADYDEVAEALRAGSLSFDDRQSLAAKAFAHVSAYDSLVSAFLRDDTRGELPREITFSGRKVQDLRYGENPAQRAAVYQRLSTGRAARGVLAAQQLSGKELSFNNLLDADAAWSAIQGCERPTVAIVKHTIPCGLASRDTLQDAFVEALAGDPVSAFGGIVSLNREVDGETAEKLSATFFEVIIAPGFSEEGATTLRRKPALRLLEMPPPEGSVGNTGQLDIRPIGGGLLVQDADDRPDDPTSWRVVTARQPTEEETRDLRFAWHAARHVTSNAIVFARDDAVVGVGSGQPNRLESVAIAARKAGDRADGAAMASDAFFPFADGIEAAIAAGITSIIQPGGSVRDEDVIAAANAANVAMVFTGTRHFRH